MFRMSGLPRTAATIALTGLVGFTAGYASGGTAYATQLNKGLANAFSEVGQNLFGSAVFGAQTIPGNPVIPGNPIIQMDLANDTKIPTRLQVVIPPDPIEGGPCLTVAQIDVGPNGVTAFVNQDVVGHQDLVVSPSSLPRCQVAPIN